MLLTALAIAAAPVRSLAIVRTDAGAIAGEALPDGRQLFRGIPYAQPPVGPLRWKPPLPVRPWRGVRDATRFAPACMQTDYGWNREPASYQSEDCLYLEVATPNPRPPKPLPVMVWIHGGGNRGGDPEGTIHSDLSKQVVLVALQYRLGAFGFMSHPSLTAESPKHASGNYALMDQQAALRWVRANIARFGGDPRNVTLFGQSAGAQDVGLQLLSPSARGLFSKAIEESGAPGFGVPPRSLAQNEYLGELIARAAGAPARASAAELRAIPAREILEATERVNVPDLSDDNYIWLQAVVDGWVLREPPAAALARGDEARVPLIIGTNARELDRFGGKRRARETIEWVFGPRAPEAQDFYDNVPDPDPRRGDVGLQLSTDFIFACPSGVVAAAHSRAGNPVWQYEFDYAPPGARVSHSSEIRFVMQAPANTLPGAPPLQNYWVNFARTGNPNGIGLTPWLTYAPGARYINFEEGRSVMRANLRGAICRLRDAP